MDLVTLSSLPQYGIFRTTTTGLRGLILKWLRSRIGKRREAIVLLTGNGHSERRLIHADAKVLTDPKLVGINGSTRPFCGTDVFRHTNPKVWCRDARRVAVPRRPWMMRPAALSFPYLAVFS